MSLSPERRDPAAHSWLPAAFILAVTLGLPGPAHAQTEGIIGSLSQEDGLTDSRVFVIHQDQAGFMWFGTRNGLNRFDGYEIRTYLHDPDDPNSLSDSVIEILLEDSSGALWIGTNRGGLNRFDPDTETFTRYIHDPDDPTTLSHNLVHRLFEDSRGRIWAGTGGGASVLDPETGEITRYEHDPDDHATLSHPGVVDFAEDRSGRIWVATGNGLNRIVPETGHIQRFHYDSEVTGMHNSGYAGMLNRGYVREILVDSRGDWWLATMYGLKHFDPETGSTRSYEYHPADPRSLGDDRIWRLFEDSLQRIWVGTETGVDRFDPVTEEFVRYGLEPAAAVTFGGTDVVDIHEDQTGTIWVAARAGLYRLDPEIDEFILYAHDPTDPETLSDDRIRDIYEDAGGILWVGTVNGVNRINPATTVFDHFAADPGDSTSLTSSDVLALFEDRAGDLWVSTVDGVVSRRSATSGGFTPVLVLGAANPRARHAVHDIHEDDAGALLFASTEGLYRADPSGAANDYVQPSISEASPLYPTVLHRNKEGTLWLGTADGLWVVDSAWRELTPFPIGQREEPARQVPITAVHTDAGGLLWVGWWGTGMASIDRSTGEITWYAHDPTDPGSLSSDLVSAIHEDSNGNLWVATSLALDLLDRSSGRFRGYKVPAGVQASDVRSILEDGKGSLWLTTANDLLRFDPDAETFTRFGAADGLRPNLYRTRASHLGRSGTAYIGGLQGFSRFRPEMIRDFLPPPVVITQMRMGNQPVAIGDDSVLERSITSTEEITLAHTGDTVSFEFAALSYADPARHRYQYRLEGLTENWVEVSAEQRQATYAGLSPGTYTFRVLGSNHRGNWNEEGASLRVIVLPAWWETPWFLTLALIGIVGIVVAGHRVRTRTLERRNIALEREIAERKKAEAERDRVEEELRKQRTELAHATRVTTMGELAASLAHELNQPLAAIVSNAQAGRRFLTAPTLDTEEVEGALADIADQGRQAGEVIRHLREFLSKGESAPTLLNVNEVVTSAARLLESDARGRGLALDLVLGDNLPPVMGTRVGIEQVLVNLVVNALDAMSDVPDIKEGNGIVTIRTGSGAGGFVEVTVEDRGPGIAPEAVDDLFEPFLTTKPGGMGMGLPISHSIIEAHGGRLWVTDRTSGGTALHFTLPVAE